MKKKIVYIKGMHCVACEKLLKDEFDAIEGVIDAKVDRKANTAEIFYKGAEPDFSEIKKTAKKFGYDAFESREELKNSNLRHPMSQNSWMDWVNAVLIVAALLFVYKVFKNLGFLDKINLNSDEVTLGIAFLIGLVASISSCLAVVGSVIIAFGEKYKSNGGGFFESAVKPNLFFHIGRLATFFALGGALGMIGGKISISGNFISVFTIIIAAVMGWLGLNILGLAPSISNLGIRMPGKLTNKWNKLKESEHKVAPFLLGGLSFFLPCGFTQSMQIFAFTSGSFLAGGMTLLIFALGTMPALLILGVTTSWTKGQKMVVFQKVAGMLILLFAIYTFQSGLALKGVKTDVLSIDNRPTSPTGGQPTNNNQNQPAQEQIVETKLTYNGYEPAVIKIKKGIPVKFIIKGEQVSGCTNRIIIPAFNITKNISYGENIIKFTPTKAGTIDFSCWMGMVRGKFLVE
ncbi:MAG: sulfite exporter TauE/SafE family protein [Patescibacteria group bacterium]